MSKNVGVRFEIKELRKMLKERRLNENGTAQQVMDNEVMRLMEPYMQKDTGMMIKSMILATDVGSGEVIVNTPYAHMRLHNGPTNGLRGPEYFERMKADRKDDILRSVAKITGGKAR